MRKIAVERRGRVTVLTPTAPATGRPWTLQRVWSSDDFAEGRRARAEKRAPGFTGR